MDLSRVIIGPMVTEKSERLKAQGKTKVYTMQVRNDATKIDIKAALQKYYDVEVASVRVQNTIGKTRMVGNNRAIQKRKPARKALVTLTANSKPLDLASFKIS